MFGVAFDKIILTIVGSIMVLVPVIILVFIMYHRKHDEKPIDSANEKASSENTETENK